MCFGIPIHRLIALSWVLTGRRMLVAATFLLTLCGCVVDSAEAVKIRVPEPYSKQLNIQELETDGKSTTELFKWGFKVDDPEFRWELTEELSRREADRITNPERYTKTVKIETDNLPTSELFRWGSNTTDPKIHYDLTNELLRRPLPFQRLVDTQLPSNSPPNISITPPSSPPSQPGITGSRRNSSDSSLKICPFAGKIARTGRTNSATERTYIRVGKDQSADQKERKYRSRPISVSSHQSIQPEPKPHVPSHQSFQPEPKSQFDFETVQTTHT
jgi:hypothetical protein